MNWLDSDSFVHVALSGQNGFSNDVAAVCLRRWKERGLIDKIV
jgi:hypothetical protein